MNLFIAIRRFIYVTMSFFFFFCFNKAFSEVRIEINQGVVTSTPIAIVSFKLSGLSTMPEDLANIVTSDLRNCGKFDPLNVARFPQFPKDIDELQPELWNSLGIGLIIIGEVQLNPDSSYQISYKLINIENPQKKDVILQNTYKASEKWLRYVGHTISNEVFEKIINIKGAFCTRIAYIVQTNEGDVPYELRISDYDGYNEFVVHRSLQPLMSPAWSSDGSKLAYVTFEKGRSELVVEVLSNSLIHRIASYPCHNGAPSFSPDGTKLAFVLSKNGSLNLYVMDLNSGEVHQITDDHYNNTEPNWFPNNKNLVFTSDQTGVPQVYKISIDGGSSERISWLEGQNQNASISVDGKSMIMISINSGLQHVVKQNLVTGEVQVLTDTFLDETPTIAPNGTMVIYSAVEGMGSILKLVSIDGRFKSVLPATDGQVKFPAWSPYL